MPAVTLMMKVFEYAVLPVSLTAKYDDTHNMETSEFHINYICSAEIMSR
jgi:hypothetical protein